MRKKLFLSTLAIPLLAISGANGATVLFDFRTSNGSGIVDGNGTAPTDSNFDTSSTGDTVTLGATGDPSTTLTTTILDVFAPEYDVTGAIPVLTGNILSGVDGAVVTNISGQDSLAIGNPSISNTQFDLIGGGTESSDFNSGEGFTFSFNQDVTFTSIELESVVATDTLTIAIDGTDLITYTGDDAFIDDLGVLGSTVITAGQEITFTAGGDIATSSFRIETFQVNIVPEPSSSALIGLAGLMMLARRRR